MLRTRGLLALGLLLATSLAGCLQEDSVSTDLGSDTWEPYTRLLGAGHMGFTFRACLPPDGHPLRGESCLERDLMVESFTCNPPQLAAMQYRMARETGTWPAMKDLATGTNLREMAAAHEPGGGFLGCTLRLTWGAHGTSLVPGRFDVDVGGPVASSASCSVGPLNEPCQVGGVIELHRTFDGAGEDHEDVVTWQASFHYAGLVRSLSGADDEWTFFMQS